jgi:hypothetical protein
MRSILWVVVQRTGCFAPPENIEYYVKAARQYGDYRNIR